MAPLVLLFLLIARFTAGADGVSTVTLVTIQNGRPLIIPCFYGHHYKTHVKYWCRGFFWSTCTPIVRTGSPQKEGEVSITDDPAQQVFTVTMNNLRTEDSGYYWCAVEIGGHGSPDDRVYLYLTITDGSPLLSVDKQEVIGVEGENVSVQCRYGNTGSQILWCKIGGSCVSESSSLDGRPVLIRDDRVNKVFNVTMRGLERKDTGWYWCDDGYRQIPVHINVTQTNFSNGSRIDGVGPNVIKASGRNFLQALMLPLGLLLLLLAILSIWMGWKKHRWMSAEKRRRSSLALNPNTEPDITYSTVISKKTDAQQMISSDDLPSGAQANDVVYSSVFLKDR